MSYKIHILVAILIIAVVFASSPVLSAEIDPAVLNNMPNRSLGNPIVVSKTLGGLTFSVTEVRRNEWISGLAQKPSIGMTVGSRIYEKKPMIAVSFEFVNSDPNRKIDMGQGFQYALRDEFHNHYRQYHRPKNYFGPAQIRPKSFPSIYPGEKYRKIVFFEAPIENSSELVFTVDASNIGMEKAADLPFSTTVIQAPDTSEGMMDTSAVRLKIISSVKRGTVIPGERLYMRIRVFGAQRPPDRIFIVSPIFALEDRKPAYTYELNIPRSQPQGDLTIIAIAKWIEGDEEILASEAITFQVIDPNEVCMQNCNEADKI